MDFVGKDEIFLELLDWYKTFPKVWDLLGWNIQLYHSHMTVTPPGPPDEAAVKKRLGWHQDSARLNAELETTPQPRISLKIGFFLTDTTEEGRGNFYVLPGSQLQKTPDFPPDGVSDPEGGNSCEGATRHSGIFRSAALAFCQSKLFKYPAKSAFLRLQLPVVKA